MSERYNGNTGWEQDLNGNVVTDYRGDNAPHFPGYEREVPHDSALDLIHRRLDAGGPISQEEGRLLNEIARINRGGIDLKPKLEYSFEKPRRGRNNWQ